MSLGVGSVGPRVNGASAVSLCAVVTADSFSGAANNNRAISWILNSTTAGGYLAVHNGASAVVRVGGRSGNADSFQAANGTTVLAAGTEYRIGGVLDYANDKIRVYVNGVQEANLTVTFSNSAYTHGTASAVDAIGGDNIPSSNTNAQFDGRLSEICIWAGDIGDDGFAQLADCVSPALIRPNLIVDYLPLMGANSPERGWFGELSGTIAGTVAKADHPRIILPRGSRTRKLTTATGGGVSVTPAAASITITGTTPTVSTPTVCTPAAASVTITGTTPSVVLGTVLTPAAATITLTGTTPTVSTPVVCSPAAAAVTITGTTPTVTATTNVQVTPTPATITFTGTVPTVTGGQSATVAPAAATIAIAGTVPVVTVAEVSDDAGGPAPKTVGRRKPVTPKPATPKYRVFDTYSSKPTVQQSAQAVEQEQARVRKVANRRAAILAAVMAACEDDYLG